MFLWYLKIPYTFIYRKIACRGEYKSVIRRYTAFLE